MKTITYLSLLFLTVGCTTTKVHDESKHYVYNNHQSNYQSNHQERNVAPERPRPSYDMFGGNFPVPQQSDQDFVNNLPQNKNEFTVDEILGSVNPPPARPRSYVPPYPVYAKGPSPLMFPKHYGPNAPYPYGGF